MANSENLVEIIDRQIGLIEEQRRDLTRLRKIERAAHFLLVWKFQDSINADNMPARGWWRVDDLDRGIFDQMNSAEQELFAALSTPTGGSDGHN